MGFVFYMVSCRVVPCRTASASYINWANATSRLPTNPPGSDTQVDVPTYYRATKPVITHANPVVHQYMHAHIYM